MKKKLLLLAFIFTLMFSAVCVQAASQKLCVPSAENVFSVEYYDANIVPGEYYSITVLKPGTDFAQMTANDILCMKQVLADNTKTISVSDIKLKAYVASADGVYGDVWIGGRGLSFSCTAVLLNHDCTASYTHYPAVPADCYGTNGTLEYWKCNTCGRHFDLNSKTIIEDIVDNQGHQWSDSEGGVFACMRCGAVKCVIGGEAEIYADNINSVLTDEEVAQGYSAVIASELLSTTSAKIQSKISSMYLGNNEAFAIDINLFKVMGETKTAVTQAPQLLKLEIALPDSLEVRDNYYVLRLHNNVVDAIGETANSDGEYFEVDKENNRVTLYAKKFSEYVIISEEEPRLATGIGNGGTSTPKPTDSGGGSDKTEDKPQEEIVQGDESAEYNFTDVSENDWFYEAVQYASSNGLMKGVSTDNFAPNDNVTRAMFVTLLYRMENEPSVKATKKFTDVKTGEWYSDAVSWASDKAIVSGVDSNNFAPDNAISREQLATMLYRYAIYKKCNISAAENTGLAEYEDADNVSQYALSAIKWAVGEKIIIGKTQTTLNPQDNTTRAETAALLMRIADKLS